jgi:hypothetical protein
VRWGQEGLGRAREPLIARSRKDVHSDPYPEAVAHSRAGPSNVRANASMLDFGPGRLIRAVRSASLLSRTRWTRRRELAKSVARHVDTHRDI